MDILRKKGTTKVQRLEGPTACSSGAISCWNLVGTGKVITEKITNGNVNFAAASGGGTAGKTVNLGNGKYRAAYTTGPEPTVNTVEAGGSATINVPRVLYNPMVTGTVVPSFGADYSGSTKPLAITEYRTEQLQCSPTGCSLPTASVTLKGGQQTIFYAAEPLQQATGLEQKAKYTLYGVDVTLALEPKVVFLNEKGYSYADTKLNYTILPPEYNASIVDVDIFKNGAWQGYLVGGATQGTGITTVTAGSALDVNSSYTVQALLNRGSDVEIKGAQISLPVAKINKIEVYDKYNECNRAPGKLLPDMLILATDSSNNAHPAMRSDIEARSENVREGLLWRFIGNAASPESGNFIVRDPYATLTPSASDYMLYVGIDNDNNGKLESTDTIIRSFQVKAIPAATYSVNYHELDLAARGAEYFQHKLSSSFLLTFLGSPDDAPIKPTEPAILEVITSDEPTHVAGADFTKQADTNICKAKIYRYVYNNNEAATVVVKSKQVQDWVMDVLHKNYIAGTLLPGQLPPFDYPKNTITFNEGAAKASDAGLAFGTASVKLTGTANIVNDLPGGLCFGRACVESVNVSGEVNDLYDFDYFKEVPAPLAASMQFGWNSKLSDYSAKPDTGRIFRETIMINKTCSYAKDDMGILFVQCY